MSGVVEVPIAMKDAAFFFNPVIEGGPRVGRHDVEGRGLDGGLDRPVDGSFENIRAVVVHPEDEGGIDHDAVVVEAADSVGVGAVEVLDFRVVSEIGFGEGLEADEE